MKTASSIMRQAIRFTVVGLSNTLTTFIVIWLMTELMKTPIASASAGGYLTGMVQGFLLNRFWTFETSVRTTAALAYQLIAFVIVNLVCGASFTLVNVWLHSRFSLSLLESSVLATSLVVPLSFALNRWIVFSGGRINRLN